MASPAVIGALRVVLGADSAALTSGLDEARGRLSDFGANAAKAAAVIGAAITAAYGAVALGVGNTIASMDQLGKQSQKIGIPVEQLSALKLAADTSGISMDQLGTGLGKLSKAMVEAAAKPTSEAANAFRALGVSATDGSGQLRPVIDVASSIADKFAGLKDGAGKTAVSMALMGRAGNELIPLLNTGADGLGKMMQNAQAFGIVIDTQTAKAAEKFRDTLTMVNAAKDGMITRLTAYLLPALQQFANRMLDAASNSDKQATKLAILQAGFDAVSRVILVVADNFKLLLQLGAVWVASSIAAATINAALAFAKLAASVQVLGWTMAAFEAIRSLSLRGLLLIAGVVALVTGQFDNLTSTLKDVGSKIESIMPEGTSAAITNAVKALGIDISALTTDLTKFQTANDAATKSQKDFNYAAMGGKTAVDTFLDSTMKAAAGQTAEAQTVGMAADAKARLKTVLEAYQIAAANSVVITDALRTKISATATAAGDAALQLQGQQLVFQNLTPLQQYEIQLNNVTIAMQRVGATAEQIARAQEGVAQQFGMSWQNIGQNIAGTAGALSQLTGVYAKENKTMGVLSKAFGIGQAIINTQIAITKALATLPPPASYAAVAFAIAQGAASVATISAQKFKMGADFTVPGGVGGGDRVPFNAMLEPGERVRVEPNRYGETDNGSSGAQPSIISLAIPDSAIRTFMRGIIDGIGDQHRNGYVLKLA